MSSSWLAAMGYLAGTLTTLSFVPQLVKTWQCKSGAELSFAWLFAFGVGVALWLVYGVYLHSWPITIANAVTLFLILLIVTLKCRYR